MWIWTTHKACTLYVGGNRTHRQNPNVFNPYACLLAIRCLPFCIHINSRCPPTNADTRTRTLITILLVREISNLLWYHYTISADGWKRNRTSIVYHVGTDLQSAATPPIVAVRPRIFFVSPRTLGKKRWVPFSLELCSQVDSNHHSAPMLTLFNRQGGNRTHDKSANSRLLYHWATSR